VAGMEALAGDAPISAAKCSASHLVV